MDLQTEYLEHKIGQLMESWPGVPADSLEDLCASRGLAIGWADLGPVRLGALDLWEAAILVNSRIDAILGGQADVWGCRAHVIAHELGHFLLHRAELLAGVELTELHEEEAFLFADCLLMPREMLRADPSVRTIVQHWQHRQQMRPRQLDYELEAAAGRFGVSRSALGNRLVRLNTLEKTLRGYRILGRPTPPVPRPPQPSPPTSTDRHLVAN